MRRTADGVERGHRRSHRCHWHERVSSRTLLVPGEREKFDGTGQVVEEEHVAFSIWRVNDRCIWQSVQIVCEYLVQIHDGCRISGGER
jgi:hypothetical protein